MRELVFALKYAPGNNAIADILADNPETKIRSLSCHVSANNLWRVDHVTGGERALDELTETVANAEYYTDCLARRDCEADWETQVLDRTDDALVLYSYWSRTPSCTSIPHLALEHFGEGLIFQTTWVGHRYEWRIIAPDDTSYHSFRNAIEDEIGDTTGVTFVRVGDTDDATPDDGSPSLTPEQDAAMRAAVQHGYYKTPREIETYELAEKLDIPGSTLSYRLRRAEAQLADAYVTDHAHSPHLSSPDT
ncbi:helix-turn-helix domain-containing protein [Haloarcula sp. JP-L23]|uniref:helix-turn-helix domain-containing protein n=1 Tax=Haloarcula sp. JP-L23 TaxID=2716717 RepID=UPI00140F4A7B|nr:transcriptional regulator [Haloarcula sp. JP-L23]